MNCEEVRAILAESHEGAIEGSLRREAEAHLSGCAACRAAQEEGRKLDRFLRRNVRIPEPPREFWSRQEARVLERAGGRSGRRLTIPARVLIGAGIAAALAVAFILPFRPANPPGPRPAAEADPTSAGTVPPEVVVIQESRTPIWEPKSEKPVPGTAERPPTFFFPRVTEDADPSPSPGGKEPSVPLPGDPAHLDRLMDEAVEVGLAETGACRVAGLLRAAEARLAELRVAIRSGDRDAAEELAEACHMIFKEGIAALLEDRSFEEGDRVAARAAARDGARSSAETLAKLEPGAEGTLKSALRGALLAAREVAGH